MPYQGGVQLLPKARKQVAPRREGPGRMVYVGLAIGAIVLVANITLDAFGTSVEEKIAALDGQMRTQENQRDKEREEALEQTQKQSLQMTRLLNDHLYWSQALEAIEQLMQSNVIFDQISADESSGVVTFSAVGPSYAAVAKQIASFTAGEGVDDVTIQGVEIAQEGGVEFAGEITIDTTKMLKRLKETLKPGDREE